MTIVIRCGKDLGGRSHDLPNSDMRENRKEMNISREVLRDNLVFTPQEGQLGGLTLVIESSAWEST